MARFRDLKSGLRGFLSAPDWRTRLTGLADVPARRLPGPLFSLLLDREEPVRWRAVEVFGLSVARLAESVDPGEGMEAARDQVAEELMFALGVGAFLAGP